MGKFANHFSGKTLCKGFWVKHGTNKKKQAAPEQKRGKSEKDRIRKAKLLSSGDSCPDILSGNNF